MAKKEKKVKNRALYFLIFCKLVIYVGSSEYWLFYFKD